MAPESLPEDKLLNLIRNGKRLKEPVSENRLKASKKNIREKPVNVFLISVNYLFIVTVIGLAIYLAYDFLETEQQGPGPWPQVPSSQQPEEEITQPQQGQRPFSYYEQQFKRRDIFEQPQDKTVVENVSATLLRNFRLVGIVLSEIPEAIIEDMQSKRTLFVHEGDPVNGAQVLHIQEGKVILFYQGEEFELVQ